MDELELQRLDVQHDLPGVQYKITCQGEVSVPAKEAPKENPRSNTGMNEASAGELSFKDLGFEQFENKNKPRLSVHKTVCKGVSDVYKTAWEDDYLNNLYRLANFANQEKQHIVVVFDAEDIKYAEQKICHLSWDQTVENIWGYMLERTRKTLQGNSFFHLVIRIGLEGGIYTGFKHDSNPRLISSHPAPKAAFFDLTRTTAWGIVQTGPTHTLLSLPTARFNDFVTADRGEIDYRYGGSYGHASGAIGAMNRMRRKNRRRGQPRAERKNHIGTE